MKHLLFLLPAFFCFSITKSQTPGGDTHKFIEVTGSAELEIEPDEVTLIIGIGEYWKEEFDTKKDFKDYHTKVKIEEIELNLMNDLKKIGITSDRIIIREVGNYWRSRGKDFLINKEFELALTDLKKVNEIINFINTKGINFMKIDELKNSKISEYRKKVKIEALKAAKEKADYLLKSIDKQLGDIISITEAEDNNNRNFYPWLSQSVVSNTTMNNTENSDTNNLRKIKLRYEIQAKFEIR